MYVCPHCKEPLLEHRCRRCALEFPVYDGIPCFLVESSTAGREPVRDIYEEIYRHHEDVWADQGRSEAFLAYLSALAASLSQGRVLEVGCGEGALLTALKARERWGIDLSLNALRRAVARSGAQCAVAQAERLPFPSSSFDLVVSVGVMEHFAEPELATAEIRRVLAPAGYYVALIQTDMSVLQRVTLKMREFLFPHFRPKALFRWVRKKVGHPIVQPLRRSYTIESARECLQRSGLSVERTLTQQTHPDAPLAGPHVVILVARKGGN